MRNVDLTHSLKKVCAIASLVHVVSINTVSYILVNLFIVVSLGVNDHTRINQFHAIVSKFTIYAFITIVSTE